MARIPGLPRKGHKFDPESFIKGARHKSAPAGDNTSAKMDETLYFIHQIKNGMTIKTGEYEALTRIFTGQKMYVDTRDVSLAPHLMLDGIWEEGFTRILRKYISEGTVMFDVGANFGYFGLVAGTEVKSGSIHFFEPNPLLANYIRKTASINGLWKCSKVVENAVGDSDTALTLTVPGDYFGSASVAINESTITNYVDKKDLRDLEVQQITLDSYVKQNGIKNVDVIKVDVEGFEPNVYAGMSAIIKSNPQLIIFLEFTADSYKDPQKFFKQIGEDFRCLYLIENDLERVESLADLQPTIDRDGFAMLAMAHKEI